MSQQDSKINNNLVEQIVDSLCDNFTRLVFSVKNNGWNSYIFEIANSDLYLILQNTTLHTSGPSFFAFVSTDYVDLLLDNINNNYQDGLYWSYSKEDQKLNESEIIDSARTDIHDFLRNHLTTLYDDDDLVSKYENKKFNKRKYSDNADM